MTEHISLREANQHLSRYIERVEQGEEIIITRRGRPVAKLVAILAKKQLTSEQQEARQRSLKRMQEGYDLGGKRLSRDNLHER